MNRITNLFNTKKNGILSVFFTAGYPNLNDTTKILKELEKKGIDMVEIGIPFSDPMADGPVIQEASTAALRNGMSLRLLFDQLENIRQDVHIPIILMGYLNPIMQYGNTTYLEVLTAQQSLLNAQLTQVANRFTEIQGVINLYQALGGGRE